MSAGQISGPDLIPFFLKAYACIRLKGTHPIRSRFIVPESFTVDLRHDKRDVSLIRKNQGNVPFCLNPDLISQTGADMAIEVKPLGL